MSTLVLSHTDLDGIACQIVIRQALNEITRMNCSYGKIDEYIDNVHHNVERTRPNKVFITDLSFTIEQLIKVSKIAECFKNTMFYFIDHHPFEEEYKHLNSDNLKIVISDKASATKLTYLFCKSNFNLKESKELESFVNYVNAYDIWLKDTPEFKPGFVYNELYWQYKQDHFWSRFKDNFSLKQGDKDYYKELMHKKKKLFDKLDKSGRMFKLGNKDVFMVFLNDFRSHIQIDYPDYKFYVIIADYGGVSVRICESIKNAAELRDDILEHVDKLDIVISSGGHDNAFGITLNSNDPSDMVDFAKVLINKISSVLKDL